MKPTRSDWLSLAVSGNLLWLGGHGLILWAEQYVASGFACLMASSSPIWAVIVELFLYRKRPSIPLIGSLAVGFVGVAVLSASSFGAKGATGFWVILVLICGAHLLGPGLSVPGAPARELSLRKSYPAINT